jgi:Glycosyltransferase family 87
MKARRSHVVGAHAKTMKYIPYWCYYPFAMLYLLMAIAILFRWKPRPEVAHALGLLAIAIFIIKTVWLHPAAGDFGHNWTAGRAWLDGRDPYPISIYMNYPPYTLPLFSLLAWLPFVTARFIWLVVTVAGTIALVPLALSSLSAVDSEHNPNLIRSQAWILLGAVVLSIPVHFSVSLGQPTIIVAICVLAAILAQTRSHGIRAGLLLATAFVKPQSAIPFFLLLFKKKAIPVWITTGTIIVALSLLSSSPLHYLTRGQEFIENNSKLQNEGVNDFTDRSDQAHSLLGLDRLVYCLGVTNRSAVRIAQLGLMTTLGLIVAWLVIDPNRLAPGAAFSLIAVYALLFTYHRTYDAVLLVVPLVYCTGCALQTSGWRRRWLHATPALAILAILFLHPRLVEVIVHHFSNIYMLGTLLRMFVLPYSSWLLLLTLVCIWVGGRPDPASNPSDVALNLAITPNYEVTASI